MKSAKTHQGRVPFDSKELRLVWQALASQNLCCIGGKMVPALESEFAAAYGVPYAVASTSGTAAIHVALGALDLDPGDEVITAPITDLGTIIPILYQNAIPVFADIDDTYNMDPADVERKITSRTRAILAVHLFGNPCNLDAMVSIAKRHQIPLIEDCSQAHMTRYQGRYAGTIGDIGCFSFQQSKHMTTGDGGMTITSNKKYFERMKLFADKGYARKGWGSRAYLFHAPNYRMTELVGAVGRAQLKKVRRVVEKRSELGRRMTEMLSEIAGVSPLPGTPGAEHSYWMYPLRVHGADIDLLAQEMAKEKIPALLGYTGKPIYLCSESLTAKKTYGTSQCPFTCQGATGTYEYREGLCPRAEEALRELICIAWDESWTAEDLRRTASVLSKCLDRSGAAKPATALVKRTTEASGRQGVPSKNGKRKVRIGIVGCGQIGRWHLDSYKRNPHAELAAFADTRLECAESFSRLVNGNAYRSHREMIENEALDGVSVCTVPSTHRDVAIDLLNAGIHVLCEKPLAVSVCQAHEMLKKAEEKKLLLFPAFKFRFHDEVLRARDLIASNGFGKILNFRLMFGGQLEMGGTWYADRRISGGGVIMDNGPHAIDLIRYLFGEIETISADTTNHQNLAVEDTARLSLGLRNGILGVVDLSWCVSVPARAYLEIYGEDGTALLDLEGISYRFKTWKEWKRIPNEVNVKEAFARQIDHFIDCIMGQPGSVVENGDGLLSQIAVDTAYDSLRRGVKTSVLDP